MKSLCRLAVIAALVTPAPLAAQSTPLAAQSADELVVDEAKAALGFASWPGKNGLLKKGLHFQVADYPVLAGFETVEDRLETTDKRFGILRVLRIAREASSLRITIGVAFGSTDNGQELLLRAGLAPTQAPVAETFGRGDPSVALGDLNFVLQGDDPGDVREFVAFVRNNVVCIVENQESPLSITALAAAIDTKIRAQPDLSAAAFDLLRPQILTFAPADSSIGRGEGSFTTLQISVSEPSLEPVTHEISTDGALQIDETSGGWEVRSTHVLGLIPIKLTTTNASLQFSEAQTQVNVAPFLAPRKR